MIAFPKGKFHKLAIIDTNVNDLAGALVVGVDDL